MAVSLSCELNCTLFAVGGVAGVSFRLVSPALVESSALKYFTLCKADAPRERPPSGIKIPPSRTTRTLAGSLTARAGTFEQTDYDISFIGATRATTYVHGSQTSTTNEKRGIKLTRRRSRDYKQGIRTQHNRYHSVLSERG
ncbi:hypothetical protein BOTBODRAFT_218381 [Botryobasidium botryosum FD-172 SS1]|uniref:Uncharacterized protein n=1 Tax=Botryobasidium botryosum (strain FD-172 SS1) TaxID=930990 RepID=A0A067MZE9_BOTB1|nr:hypothetical protein BOTBODRAFT_218381 [Botryobasidium botryosum FD-172 SS1]